MSGQIIYTSEAKFEEEVLNAELPILLDFWAEWCGPCKMVNPILEEIAEEYKGKLQVAKVNVDTDSSIAAKYNVRGIPTLAIFKEGKIVDYKVGALSKIALAEFIDKQL